MIGEKERRGGDRWTDRQTDKERGVLVSGGVWGEATYHQLKVCLVGCLFSSYSFFLKPFQESGEKILKKQDKEGKILGARSWEGSQASAGRQVSEGSRGSLSDDDSVPCGAGSKALLWGAACLPRQCQSKAQPGVHTEEKLLSLPKGDHLAST